MSEDLRTVSVPNEVLLAQVGELIAGGHQVTIKVRGNSMNPFFVDRRDDVTLSPFTKRDLCVGAVVLARDATGRFILHRIVRKEGNDITMMGDGNWRGVEHTTPSDVIGLVTGGIRKGKKISCTGLGWDVYSWAWMRLRPVRRWLLAAWRRLQF